MQTVEKSHVSPVILLLVVVSPVGLPVLVISLVGILIVIARPVVLQVGVVVSEVA